MKKYSLSFIGLLLLSFLIIPFKATAIENNSDDDMTNITKACDFIFNERSFGLTIPYGVEVLLLAM